MFQDPTTGQWLPDVEDLDKGGYPEYPPPKGCCAACGNGGVGMKCCKHSSYSIGSMEALRWCAPVPLGYVPRKLRP